MAGVSFSAQSAAVALAAATKKTVLQITAPTNQRVKVKEWSVSFDGVSNTAIPVLVEIARQSTAGTGGDALTLVKTNAGDDETLQTTGQTDVDTGNPTETSVLVAEKVHPQGGMTWQAPFGEEIIVKGGERLGIAVTAPATVNVVARFRCEE